MSHPIQHLYWRAGFGLSPEGWAEKKKWPVRKAVDELFSQAKNPRLLQVPEAGMPENPRSLSREQILERQKEERRKVLEHNIGWLERMSNPGESPLLEKMVLFWHGHFACDTDISRLAIQQLNTLRTHALGNFRDLLLGIARDPSMIRYLNNQQNRKEKPNENFARELLELFTIGRGHYTEKDIKEAARAFTGWSSTLQGDFIFRPLQHDNGPKTFFGKAGNFDGTDIIDLILEKRETALFITRKIYRFFVNEQIDEPIVNALASQFYQSGYDIGRLMRSILESDWFYAKHNQGNRIKSPVELLAGLMTAFQVKFENELAPLFVQRALGQVLFHPPNVAGWPGGRSWIDNSTLMLRLNLPNFLLTTIEVNFRPKDDLQAGERGQAFRRLNAATNLEPLKKVVRGKTKPEIIGELAAYFLPDPGKADADLIHQFAPAEDPQDFFRQAVMRITSMPEYQMC